MIPYALIRPFLFLLDGESAHELTVHSMSCLQGIMPRFANKGKPVRVMGIDFPNAVGLAAGMDKNGVCMEGFGKLGCGHVEIGTITPRPQPGNPKPRMFRIKEREAIINRMGFNNHGVDALLANVAASRYKGVLGINIGKNADTPIERAVDDYLICLEKVYDAATYVAVNISSPNTKNLRQLQGENELDDLLSQLKRKQSDMAQKYGHYVPLVLKIAPDLDEAQLTSIAALLRRHRIDGVIATNTTLSREAVANLPHANEAGGLSGAPLFEPSTAVVAQLAKLLAGEVPIIAAGGIMNGEMARAKLKAGASLVQVYSGMVYRGPDLIGECAAACARP